MPRKRCSICTSIMMSSVTVITGRTRTSLLHVVEVL